MIPIQHHGFILLFFLFIFITPCSDTEAPSFLNILIYLINFPPGNQSLIFIATAISHCHRYVLACVSPLLYLPQCSAAHLQMVPSPHETPHREGVLFIPLKFGIPTQAALATSPFSPCLGSVLLRWRAHARGCRPHPTGPGPPRQAPSSSASHPA